MPAAPTNAARVTVPTAARLYFGRMRAGSNAMPVVTATAATTKALLFP